MEMQVTGGWFLFVWIICLVYTLEECSGMPLRCGAGEFLNKTDGINSFCQECPSNYYIEDVQHEMKSCEPCENYIADIHHVEEVQPCTKKSRAKILKCADGFRLEVSPHFQVCKPCPLDTETPDCYKSVPDNITTVDSLDPSPVTTSSTTTPTDSTYKGDESCVHRPDNCSNDEFLNVNCTRIKEAIGGVFCQPCPIGTHMNKTNHSERSCVSISLSYNDTEANNGFFEKYYFNTILVTNIGLVFITIAVSVFFILLICISKGKLCFRYNKVPTNST